MSVWYLAVIELNKSFLHGSTLSLFTLNVWNYGRQFLFSSLFPFSLYHCVFLAFVFNFKISPETFWLKWLFCTDNFKICTNNFSKIYCIVEVWYGDEFKYIVFLFIITVYLFLFMYLSIYLLLALYLCCMFHLLWAYRILHSRVLW